MRRGMVIVVLALASKPAFTFGAEAKGAAPTLVEAELPELRRAIRKPGAQAVLVNVWATWCDPCREEMPDILRFYRENRPRGLHLVLISADDPEDKAKVQQFLASQGVDFPTYLRRGSDDMAFINGLEPRWSGALPASFLYDSRGVKKHFWSGPVSYEGLSRKLAEVLPPKRRQPKRGGAP